VYLQADQSITKITYDKFMMQTSQLVAIMKTTIVHFVMTQRGTWR